MSEPGRQKPVPRSLRGAIIQGMKPAGVALVFLIAPLFGQSPSVVASFGYTTPRPVTVAPGQVITLFARTGTTLIQALVADVSSLPITLGGFSVALSQTFSTDSIALPILSAAPVQTCTGVQPLICANFTAITVQIPFELVPNAASSRQPENFAFVTVSDGGNAGEPVAIAPVSEQIHIVNTCDTSVNPPVEPCAPMFLHGDGTVVTSKKPAAPGETITLRAYGMGFGDSPVATGQPAPSPAVAVSGVTAEFRFGADVVVSRPAADAASLAVQFAPGAVGLYQASFTVPAIPDGTADCTATAGNLTVVIARGKSFDGAAFCVTNPQPQQ